MVRLIEADGTQVGIVSNEDAVSRADAVGMDLVMMAEGETPVCKIMDYGKHVFESKKQKAAQKVAPQSEFSIDVSLVWKATEADGLILGPLPSVSWSVNFTIDHENTVGLDNFRVASYNAATGEPGLPLSEPRARSQEGSPLQWRVKPPPCTSSALVRPGHLLMIFYASIFRPSFYMIFMVF